VNWFHFWLEKDQGLIIARIRLFCTVRGLFISLGKHFEQSLSAAITLSWKVSCTLTAGYTSLSCTIGI
jgi:hypothetical protein